MKPVQIEETIKNFFQVSCVRVRVYVVRKWPFRGRSCFVCWNITRVSLWLLCNVHFVQSTQRTPPTDKNIRAWYKQSTEYNYLCKQKSSGRPLPVEAMAPEVL
jgi:hypothetical protein